MEFYEGDIFEVLRSLGIFVVETSEGAYQLDSESFGKLVRELRALNGIIDGLQATLVRVTRPEADVFRCAPKLLRRHCSTLQRRLRYLHEQIEAAEAEGDPWGGTARDRTEVNALEVAVPMLDAASKQAALDADQYRGGCKLKYDPAFKRER